MEEAGTKYDENHTNNILSISSSVFKRLQWTYLIGYLLTGAGDNLQGAYQYSLYNSYGMSRSTIEVLYVASYGSSLCIGTFAASLADRYGRRWACFLSAFFYIVYCFLINFKLIWVLIIGSMFWGIANAFYNTAFEAWLIQEHRERLLDVQSLKRILRNSYIGIALAAIGIGVFAHYLVQMSNFTAPFDLSIIFSCLTIIFIWQFWSENYGNKATKPTTSFMSAFQILRSDPRIVLLGLSSALFEASLYIYVVERIPTLQRAISLVDYYPLPLGFIFVLFMTFEMVGSLIFDPLAKQIRVQSYMIVVFVLATIGLMMPFIVPNSPRSILCGFFLFEFCVGIYRPSISLLRSQYIPNAVRSTMMSYMRVPQMIFILIILLSHLPLSIVFIICVVFNFLSMICMIILRGLKLPEEQAYIGEIQILLDEPSSPLFNMKQLQIRPSSSASLIPQMSIKSEDNYQSTSAMDNGQSH